MLKVERPEDQSAAARNKRAATGQQYYDKYAGKGGISMSVRIAHASISEKGTVNGTRGDQTQKEVCIRSWYSKPWDYVANSKQGGDRRDCCRDSEPEGDNKADRSKAGCTGRVCDGMGSCKTGKENGGRTGAERNGSRDTGADRRYHVSVSEQLKSTGKNHFPLYASRSFNARIKLLMISSRWRYCWGGRSEILEGKTEWSLAFISPRSR